MNCVNCNSRLFLFNETEELYPGSERVFCSSCRKKIIPFLEDAVLTGTHAEHLEAWRGDLTAAGVTPRGMSALSAYCAYMDRITPRRPAEIQKVAREESQSQPAAQRAPQQPPIAVVSAREITGKLAELESEVKTMRGKVTRMMRTLRCTTWAALAAALTGLGSLIALAANLAGCV